jgi:hypothetical protein
MPARGRPHREAGTALPARHQRSQELTPIGEITVIGPELMSENVLSTSSASQ